MTKELVPSPTGLYATEKWVYSGLVQFEAQSNPQLAKLLTEQGRIYKTYYLSETDPYAFNSPEEVDDYLAKTAAEFLAAMEAGQTQAYIDQRSQLQQAAEEAGRKIAQELANR